MARGTQTGRAMKRVVNVRLTPEQDDAIEQLAAREQITASQALRELLDMGRMHLAGVVDGIAITPEVRKLGVTTDVMTAWRAGLTPAMCRAVGVAVEHQGAVLMTTEQGALCDELAEDAES